MFQTGEVYAPPTYAKKKLDFKTHPNALCGGGRGPMFVPVSKATTVKIFLNRFNSSVSSKAKRSSRATETVFNIKRKGCKTLFLLSQWYISWLLKARQRFFFLSEKSTWRIPSSHLGEIKLAGRGDPNFALREGGVAIFLMILKEYFLFTYWIAQGGSKCSFLKFRKKLNCMPSERL